MTVTERHFERILSLSRRKARVTLYLMRLAALVMFVVPVMEHRIVAMAVSGLFLAVLMLPLGSWLDRFVREVLEDRCEIWRKDEEKAA